MRRAVLACMAAVVALTACSPTAVPERDRTVVITARHSRFEPATVTVATGTTVRFVLRNHDPIDHEFIVGPKEVHDRHQDGTEPQHGDVPGEVSVPAGREASTTYTFTSGGAVQFACHLPGHRAYGMVGTVVVRA